jgi:SAM-dependent methyltransferase
MSDPHDVEAPSAWLVRHAHLIAPGARVLDVAAGRGRHARFLARRGARVTAVDRDAEALRALAGEPGVTTCVADLEADPWPFAERFDAIVVANYLHRPLMPVLRAAMGAGAVVVYETFMTGNEAFGRPTNPAFLLAPGELLGWAAGAPSLTIVAFEQGRVTRGVRHAVVQRLVAFDPRATGPAALDPPGTGEPGGNAP